MSETVQALKDGVSWVCGMTLLSEDTEIRPASLSYVKPSEYRMSAENLIARLYDALETAQRERAEWEANAQRENAALVQAQQRIVELEADKKRLDWLEQGLRDDMCRSCHFKAGGLLFSRADWDDNAKGWDVASGVFDPFIAEGVSFREAIDAALGRMLKEGE